MTEQQMEQYLANRKAPEWVSIHVESARPGDFLRVNRFEIGTLRKVSNGKFRVNVTESTVVDIEAPYETAIPVTSIKSLERWEVRQ